MKRSVRARIKALMAEWKTLRFALSEEDAAEAWAESIALHEDQCPALSSSESTETPSLDVARVKQAVMNIAVRHQVVKDPPPPNWSLMSLYGYSAAPADLDAEIAAEYARLRPDEPPLTNANGDEPQYTDDPEYDGPLPRDGRVAP